MWPTPQRQQRALLPSLGSRRLAWIVLPLAIVLAWTALDGAWAQDVTSAPTAPETQPSASGPTQKTPAELWGAWVLIPPVVTIVLAIALRQVIPALAIGVLVAAFMLVPCLSVEEAYGGGITSGVRLAMETYLVAAVADPDHIKIILFTFLIGGMVGIVAANGGTRAIVDWIIRWASNRPRGQLAIWLAGLVVFFDDYANAMIVGPAMRPVCDRLRISRAKLAYLVDSTAAPVASIALIGTWVGAEVGFIAKGLEGIAADPPTFLEGIDLESGGYAYTLFIKSIPYRLYPILALVMVALIGWLNRDFGPMKKAERDLPVPNDAAETEQPVVGERGGRAWYASLPVLVLIAVTVGLLFVTGWPAAGLDSVEIKPDTPRVIGLLAYILNRCDTYNSILYGALAGAVLAAMISITLGVLSVGKTVDAATNSMARMFPTMIVLVLAWALSAAMEALQLGEVARQLLQGAEFDVTWLPLLIFISACVVSFATGTSWGTMGILCPAAVTVSAGLLADVPTEQALPLFYASVGSVLAGAVFGDHCSPISDTTVLSSLASGCSLESHVWTQMPYALVVAVVSMLSGEVFCRYLNLSPWIGIGIGTVALLLIVLVVGRKPRPAPVPAHNHS
ncbi:MAG: Na+/H+ antiporter NhaC family protein [Planctomycetes bacterium]|nr:Na+/H+ antiporter NhaC family protein [Planctomycetota bacterium]